MLERTTVVDFFFLAAVSGATPVALQVIGKESLCLYVLSTSDRVTAMRC